MEANQLPLTKSQLAETIIATLSLNKLGYKFFKSNYRHYYFKRETPNEAVTDMMVVCVYFRRGEISCALQSSPITKGTILYNRQFDKNLEWTQNGPRAHGYYFQKSIASLKNGLHLLLSDLDIQGKIFVQDCDMRAMHPKFLVALYFIDELKINKEKSGEQIRIDVEQKILSETGGKCMSFSKSYYSSIPFMSYYFKLFIEHPVFQNSVNQLIARLKYIEGEIKFNFYDPYSGWKEVIINDSRLATDTVTCIFLKRKKSK